MKKNKILKISLIIILSIFVIILSSVLIFVTNTISKVKDIDVCLSTSAENYSKFYDINNLSTNQTKNLNLEYVSINEIPEITKQAFLSIEDKNFYNHNGLNYKRILKATFNNLKSKSFKEGASTITQQLVKNKFLSNEKTIDRKIKEAYLSLKLEKTETKDKILETYLNTIYFGNGAYGIGEASKIFFNKKPSELDLVESSVLAGCIKSPSNYSPINNYEKSNERKNLVLKELYSDGMINEEDYINAVNQNIDISQYDENFRTQKLDIYSQYALEEASQILDTNINNVLHGGYKIYTYQNKEIQECLDKIINNEKYYHKNEYGNIADSLSIIIDNSNYSVSAIAGKSKYNLVEIKRQPGSLIKPILTYMPALEEGIINPKTQILDEEINYNGYCPKNVGNQYYGYVSVEDSVAKSLNIPAIKICEKVGLQKCKSYAEKTGIEFNNYMDNNYAVALGGFTDGVTLKSITDSYSTLTNNGKYSKSSFIRKIVDKNNMTIYEHNVTETNVYNDDTAYLMTSILDYSVDNGTSKKLSILPYDVSGKTGTVAVKNSNYNTDAYSLAYTTQHTMSVWLGNYSMNDKFNLSGKNNGGTYATEIIRDTFKLIYSNNFPADFQIPSSVKECIIDQKSLDDDHVVVLGNNVPTRYQTKSYFSKRFLPTIESQKFNIIDPFDFNINIHKNSCEILFKTYDYIDYEIYRKKENNIKLIKSIKNSNGDYVFIDKDLDLNIEYKYYIIAKCNYSNDSYITSEKKVILEKEYSELINHQEKLSDISWLFN